LEARQAIARLRAARGGEVLRLDAAWHQDEFVLDVAAGEAEGFSLPAGDEQRFVTRSPSAHQCGGSQQA
jgi:uncharacterized protein (DUF779 family)